MVSVRLGHGVGGFLATGVEQEKGEGLGVSVEWINLKDPLQGNIVKSCP